MAIVPQKMSVSSKFRLSKQMTQRVSCLLNWNQSGIGRLCLYCTVIGKTASGLIWHEAGYTSFMKPVYPAS